MKQAIATVLAVAIVALAVFSFSSYPWAAAQVSTTTGPIGFAATRVTLTGPIEIAGVPTAQQMMYVVEGQPFTVPLDKLFVCTGIGATNNGANPGINVVFDGVPLIEVRPGKEVGGGSTSGYGPSISVVPPGLVATAGTTVSVESNGQADQGILLGYLADA